MSSQELRVLCAQRLHTSPSYVKESIARLQHIDKLLERMIPHINRLRSVHKKWIEHYEKQTER